MDYNKAMGIAVDLVGRKVGLLTVLKFCGSKFTSGKLRRYYLATCKCGNEKVVSANALQRGLCKSCGCLRKRKGCDNPKWTGYGEISGNNWDYIITRCNRTWGGKKRKSKIPLKITIKDAWQLFLAQDRKCALTGLDLIFGEDRTASLDRIDSKKGYILGNLQWVHKDINRMKQCFSQDVFIQYCKMVALHNGK